MPNDVLSKLQMLMGAGGSGGSAQPMPRPGVDPRVQALQQMQGPMQGMSMPAPSIPPPTASQPATRASQPSDEELLGDVSDQLNGPFGGDTAGAGSPFTGDYEKDVEILTQNPTDGNIRLFEEMHGKENMPEGFDSEPDADPDDRR